METSLGSGVRWRCQTHSSGAWPRAMIPAGLPSWKPPLVAWSSADSPDLMEATKAEGEGVGLERKLLPWPGWPEDRWAGRRLVT